MANANGIMTTNVTATWPGTWAMFLLARGISAAPGGRADHLSPQALGSPQLGAFLCLSVQAMPCLTLPNVIGPDFRAIANTSGITHNSSSLSRDTASEGPNLILT